MKISEAVLNQYTTLILMAAGHQKIGRKFSKHLRKKDIRELLTKDPHKVAKEVEHRIIDEATTEDLTHSNLHTACVNVSSSDTCDEDREKRDNARLISRESRRF
jgi:hypothetical protein